MTSRDVLDDGSTCSSTNDANSDSGRGSHGDNSQERMQHGAPAMRHDVTNAAPPLYARAFSADAAGARAGGSRQRNNSESAAAVAEQRNNRFQAASHLAHGGAPHLSYSTPPAALQSAHNPHARRSFSAKNISHPSPILGDALRTDRRRDLLYRDVTSSAPISPVHSNRASPGPMQRPFKTRLHEVHV